jgi:BASS family bile acid:Na+ symporter
MLETLPRILTYLFLVSTMLAIGLTVTGAEILAAVRDHRLMGRVLLANLVFVPALGFLIILSVPLSSGPKLAIALLALAPGGLTAIQFTDKVRGSLAFAAAVAFVLTLLSVAVSPMLIELLLPLETGLDLPFMRILLFVLLYLLLPLIVGFGIRSGLEKSAKVLGKIMLIVSNISFVATILLTSALKREAMGATGTTTLLAMLAFIIFSMIIGWWMGGAEKGNRRVLAIATNMRNAGLSLLVAMRMFPESGADVAVIAFMGLMVPPNMLFTVYHTIKERRREKRGLRTKGPSD